MSGGVTGVGGILIPPALILLSGLDAHTAMGTALASFLPLALPPMLCLMEVAGLFGGLGVFFACA